MLPFLSKIFEKLMRARLDPYLNVNNILRRNQLGFRNNSNILDAIIEFLDYVHSLLDSKQSIVALYLDLSKVFDAVNRDILLSKYLHNGIIGTMQSWFRSYLSSRK